MFNDVCIWIDFVYFEKIQVILCPIYLNMIVIKKVDFVIFYRRVCNIIKEININITTGSNISVTFINESTKSQWTDITEEKKMLQKY